MSSAAATSETSSRILDVAEHLVQTRGFNAFSYADVAGALHVTKASLHYHFPTKAKLGERLIERYRTSFLAALDHIDQSCHDAGAKLRAYVGIYEDVLDRNRMCLCGMLAADYETLPKAMQDGVRRFFDTNEVWLAEVLERGRKNEELAFTGPPVETARVLEAALEGAMLLARSYGEPSRLRSAARHLLTSLGVKAPEDPSVGESNASPGLQQAAKSLPASNGHLVTR
jgi:TetR/AcrR family transcriptional regulator, transcriptional repressor for nem operon